MSPVNSRHFMLTIPHHLFTPYLPAGIVFVKGQLELAGSGFLHWQLVVSTGKSSRMAAIKKIFGDSVHVESTRSDAADEYVWKEDTAIAGTRFSLGKKPFVRGRETDWDEVRIAAQTGSLMSIPGDIYVRYDWPFYE
jgi:hypothetical protein